MDYDENDNETIKYKNLIEVDDDGCRFTGGKFKGCNLRDISDWRELQSLPKGDMPQAICDAIQEQIEAEKVREDEENDKLSFERGYRLRNGILY
jgi:hypothetical protein